MRMFKKIMNRLADKKNADVWGYCMLSMHNI